MHKITNVSRRKIFFACLLFLFHSSLTAQVIKVKGYGAEFQYNNHRYNFTANSLSGTANTEYDLLFLPTMHWVLNNTVRVETQFGVELHQFRYFITSFNYETKNLMSLRGNINFPIYLIKDKGKLNMKLVPGFGYEYKLSKGIEDVVSGFERPDGVKVYQHRLYYTPAANRICTEIKIALGYKLTNNSFINIFSGYSFGLNKSATYTYFSYRSKQQITIAQAQEIGLPILYNSSRESYFFFGCSFSRSRS